MYNYFISQVMKLKYHINQVLIVLILISPTACTSSVRFSSDVQVKKLSSKIAKNNSNTKDKSQKNMVSFPAYKANQLKIEKGEEKQEMPLNNLANKLSTYGTKFSNINTSSLPQGTRKNIIEEANSWIGTPYCYGGENRSGTDCSGFVMKVFRAAGIQLPRTASEQFTLGKSVDLSQARHGDLVFFQRGSRISHVGIYIGDNQIVHSSQSRGVVLQNLSTFGTNPAFIGVRSIID